MLSEDAELSVFVPHARELHSPHVRAGAQRFAGQTGGDGAQNELAMRRERAWQPREVFCLWETFENLKGLKITLLMVFNLEDGILGVSTG